MNNKHLRTSQGDAIARLASNLSAPNLVHMPGTTAIIDGAVIIPRARYSSAQPFGNKLIVSMKAFWLNRYGGR